MSKKLIAEKITFLDLCTTFQAIRNAISSAKRVEFDRFVHRWKSLMMNFNDDDGSYEFNTADSLYPVMRLFTPGLDDRAFGMKELRLNSIICKALMIQHLENCNSIPTDLLVERWVSKIEERFSSKKQQLSIYDINESLDRFTNSQQRDSVLLRLFSSCSALELRWLFHIILGDVGKALGLVHSSTILNWLHRRVDEMLRAGESLQVACEMIAADEQSGASAGGKLPVGQNLLCKPFKPMLLKRLNYNKNCLPQIIKFCRRPFYMETKFDGEHILLHRFANSAYKYFTRNGVDYTQKLGGDASTRLSAKIHDQFADAVEDCVLDCELLIWDSTMKTFVGKNRRAYDGRVYDAKHLDEDFFNNSAFERSLAVFDVLFLNGRCLIDVPLRVRYEILQKNVFVVSPDALDKSRIFIAEKRLVQTAREFVDYYNRAMRNGEEGVVVKGLDSIYKMGSRAERNGWFKIKPDYGVQSVLDLAVVALRFENGSSTKVQSFLVAAAEGEKSNFRFRIVSGISTHLKKLDFQRLMQLLRQNDARLINDSANGPPDWIVPSAKNKNDEHNNDETVRDLPGRHAADRNLKYVSRQNIQVVEVRASGVLNGRLQFPSIVSIRSDKCVEDIDTIQDVLQFEQRLRTRPMVDEEDPHEAFLIINRKRRLNFKLKDNCKILKRSDVDEKLGDALAGKKVCVLNGNAAASVQHLQRVLVSFGAEIVANSGNTTDFCVAMNPKHIKCAAAVMANRWHVIRGDWLLRCWNEAKIVPWKAEDLIHQCPTTQFDLFGNGGDSWSIDTNDGNNVNDKNGVKNKENNGYEYPANELTLDDENIAAIDRATDEEVARVADAYATCSLNAANFAADASWADDADCASLVISGGQLFSDFTFYVHASVQKLKARASELSAKIRAENGSISPALNADVTHVLVDIISSDDADELFAWNERDKCWTGVFVSMEWVDEAVNTKNRYLATDNLMKFLLL